MNTAYAVPVTPESAGWGYTSLKIIELPPTGVHRFATGVDEVIVVPLSGGAAVAVDGDRFELAGRLGVFAGPTDVAYVGPDHEVSLSSELGGRFALCGPDRGGFAGAPARRGRGAGRAARRRSNAAGRYATSAPRARFDAGADHLACGRSPRPATGRLPGAQAR